MKSVSERLNVRTGLGVEAIGQALIDNLHCLQAKTPQHATRNDWYMALAYTVRDHMLDRYICIDTALASPDDIHVWNTAPAVEQATYVVQARSVALLALTLPGPPETLHKRDDS